jgi:hypothetical protein
MSNNYAKGPSYALLFIAALLTIPSITVQKLFVSARVVFVKSDGRVEQKGNQASPVEEKQERLATPYIQFSARYVQPTTTKTTTNSLIINSVYTQHFTNSTIIAAI